MDQHLAALCALCRICGGKISTKGSYKSPKPVTVFQDAINKFDALKDINHDDVAVHPKSVCNKCYMKLYHLKDRTSQVLNWSVFQYKPHVDGDFCYVCVNGNPTSRSELVKETLISASKYGFKVCKGLL